MEEEKTKCGKCLGRFPRAGASSRVRTVSAVWCVVHTYSSPVQFAAFRALYNASGGFPLYYGIQPTTMAVGREGKNRNVTISPRKTGDFNPQRTLSKMFFVIRKRLASIRYVVLAFTANKQLSYISESLKIEYVHQHTTLATKVQIQGGGPLSVWQSTTPAGHDSSPSRDFAYIAPRSTFSGFKSL